MIRMETAAAKPKYDGDLKIKSIHPVIRERNYG